MILSCLKHVKRIPDPDTGKLERPPVNDKPSVETNTCDLCGDDDIHNECCGIKVCFSCDAKMIGFCCICDRTELNKVVFCEKCGQEGTSMTIMYCPYCDDIVCASCLYLNDSPIFVCAGDACISAFWSEIIYDNE